MEAENTRCGKRVPADGSGGCAGAGTKKRRKQLKPVRIASTDVPDSLPSNMVQVPKVIDEIDSCSESAQAPALVLVPHIKPPRCPLRDVPFQNDILSDSTGVSNVPTPDSGPSGPSLPPFNPLPNLAFSYQPWADRSHKIFNQEAYCELCKKEFCNKYFLKTHKANKHGIFSNEMNGCSSARPFPETTSSTLADPLSAEYLMNQHHHQQDAECKLKAYCDLCNKSFCNKYFVRRHKTKSHGIEDSEDLNAVQICSTNDARSTLSLPDSHDSQLLYTKEESEEPLNLVVNEDSDVSSASQPEDCTENLEKLQTMLLRLRPDTGIDDDHTDESSETEMSGNRVDPEAGSVSQSGRKQNNPTSSYCEICNKELCNKYFMRTHMQRMHGIELEHGTQIGGVVCNICNKELCSKYFLRVHKQNTHGIPGSAGLPTLRLEPKAAIRPGFSQVCYICSKRFRSSKWLQAHLQSDHREGTGETPVVDAPLEVISKLLWEGSSGSGAYSCSQCSFTTPVLAFLFVHERSHVVTGSDCVEAVKPSVALQDLIHHKTFWQHAITQPAPGLDLTPQRVSDS